MPASISVLCVYNDEAVRTECLDASLYEQIAAGTIEYIPVDNRLRQFASAGSALNSAAASATGDVLAFVHQDVALTSIPTLRAAADLLVAQPEWGVLGAVGIRSDGSIAGRIRDRVVLLGEPAHQPVEVDSLDEVLFLMRRDLAAQEPLSEDPGLAWHGYAVEIGLRIRSNGHRVGATDMSITHNSLSTNLARLVEAHHLLATMYPRVLPVRTTVGVLSAATSVRRRIKKVLSRHRWRYPWLRESVLAARAGRALGSGQVVLSNIRIDIDALLETWDRDSLEILNHDDDPRSSISHDPLVLRRHAHRVRCEAARLEVIAGRIEGLGNVDSLLVTNLHDADLNVLRTPLAGRDCTLLVHEGLAHCLLIGPVSRTRPTKWLEPRARPLGSARRRP